MAKLKLLTPENINDYSLCKLWGIEDLYGHNADLYKPLLDADHGQAFKDNYILELLDIMFQPQYLWYTCKYLLNIELAPFQVMILRELWHRKFPMFIATRGGGKSFLLALYSLLRALLTQGSKVIIIGAAFRQSKLLFEYMEQFWRGSPVLRHIIGEGKHQGPKRDIDRCTFYIGESQVTAIPVGDGSKIRGMRANYVVADEFACTEKNSLVETENGLVRIGDNDCRNLRLVTGDKNIALEFPAHYIITPPTDVYEIKMRNGYVIRCSKNHRVMTQDGWKKPLELTSNDWIESENYGVFAKSEIGINRDLAWLMGILVSEGSIVNKNIISIKTTDKILADYIVKKYGFRCYEKQAYVDKRGWNCKKSYELQLRNNILRTQLYKLGLGYNYAIDKKIPWSILQSPKHIIIAFLDGLFEGDGSCFTYKDRTCNNRLGLAYYSCSEVLCRDVHVLLDKLGFDGYINKRKSKLSENDQWFVRLNGITAYNFGKLLTVDRFQSPLNNCCLSPDPTYLCYIKKHDSWKVSFSYCGKSIQKQFKQKLDAEKYIEKLKNLPRFRRVISVVKLPDKQRLYDFYLPKTNSFYACGSRQHNSLAQEVFEVVVKGFSSVSADPMNRAFTLVRADVLRSLGFIKEADEEEADLGAGNQTIISGTAYYHFNHMYDYWRTYKSIIESKGDKRKLEEIFMGEIPPDFDWTQFSIIRVPWTKLPRGFMDAAQISQAKATVHSTIYKMEYEAVFAKDSDGFFRRSLIESCVTKKPVILSSGSVQFSAVLSGSPNKTYIYGIDPASEQDNFAIVILEIHPDHRRIVYCWTITRRDLRARLNKKGFDTNKSFYSFCANKIRDLMMVFPTDHIGMDTQGGGIAIMEALHDPANLNNGQLQPLWPYISTDEHDPFWWEKPNKPTDGEPGLHNLHMVQFANAEFTVEANHGLRKDFEDKVTLFPYFDSAEVGIAIEQDKLLNRSFDTLEDCVMDIEELKDELTTIQHTQTLSGRDKWDTPEIKEPGGKKGRLRKDRYTALVIANAVARCLTNRLSSPAYHFSGGFVGQKRGKSTGGRMYVGPDHLVQQMKVGRAVYRGV